MTEIGYHNNQYRSCNEQQLVYIVSPYIAIFRLPSLCQNTIMAKTMVKEDVWYKHLQVNQDLVCENEYTYGSYGWICMMFPCQHKKHPPPAKKKLVLAETFVIF